MGSSWVAAVPDTFSVVRVIVVWRHVGDAVDVEVNVSVVPVLYSAAIAVVPKNPATAPCQAVWAAASLMLPVELSPKDQKAPPAKVPLALCLKLAMSSPTALRSGRWRAPTRLARRPVG